MEKAVEKQNQISLLLFLSLLQKALKRLLHNDPLRMAGATAFFTTFALPFILILLSQVLGLFLDKAQARQDLYQTLGEVIGYATMQQVIEILLAFRSLAQNGVVTVIGTVFLLLVSTTLLMVIKGSMNQLWHIRVVAGRNVWQTVRIRLRSLLIIAATGVLFFFSILAEGFKAFLDSKITSLAPSFAIFFAGVVNYLFSLVFVACWFALIFRLLPDAKAPWKTAFVGALVTSVLFNLGKYLLRVLLVNSDLTTLYGASASIVLLLLFVFYTSLILYYGVAFTAVWADHKHKPIRPLRYAAHYKLGTMDETI
jgi:membrane protein